MLASAQRSHKALEVTCSGCCSSGGRKAYKNIWLTSIAGKDGTALPIHYMQLISVNHGRLLLIQLMVIKSDFATVLTMMEKALETLTFCGKLAY